MREKGKESGLVSFIEILLNIFSLPKNLQTIEKMIKMMKMMKMMKGLQKFGKGLGGFKLPFMK